MAAAALDGTIEEVEPPRQEREHKLLAQWSDVAGETTSGRLYWPRGEVSERS